MALKISAVNVGKIWIFIYSYVEIYREGAFTTIDDTLGNNICIPEKNTF